MRVDAEKLIEKMNEYRGMMAEKDGTISDREYRIVCQTIFRIKILIKELIEIEPPTMNT